MNKKRSDVGRFAEVMGVWVTKISEVYKGARIVGTVVIVGGVLSFALAFLAATPFLNPEPYEFVALAALDALLIVSGCLLYAFVAKLQYRLLIASREMQLTAFEQYVKTATPPTSEADLLKIAAGE